MKNKGKRIKSDNGMIPLPEAMIQHIQSYMSGKEAARTTILSKSWYSAWLTRPVLDLDYRDFRGKYVPVFRYGLYAKKTIQRYQGASLKIKRFRLLSDISRRWADDLIVNAINIGATDVELIFSLSGCILPKEVLGSQTLHILSLTGCTVDGNFARCSRLQSLSLKSVKIASDAFKDIVSCCVLITELSLSSCVGLTVSQVNLPKLPKLRRLILDSVYVDDTFSTDFASRFPCLKGLAILRCEGYSRIGIASTSLQTIYFSRAGGSWTAKFDVPNIRKFTYSGFDLPSQISIKGGSTEWDLDISIACYPDYVEKTSWFLNLKELLTKFRLSRISLDLYVHHEAEEVGWSEHDLDIEVVPKPLVLENLIIETHSSWCLALLLRFFGISQPKFITDTFYSWSDANASFAILYNRLMQKSVAPNCGIPDQDMFGKFGLKKVNVEVYKRSDKKQQPIVLEKPLDPSKAPVDDQKIRFELIWD